MLVEIKVTQIVMDGLAGIDQGQKSRAEGALARLEADFPNHPDTLGYRAVLLAKNGHTDEALVVVGKEDRGYSPRIAVHPTGRVG